jgi:branched-chain amino acid aminotransferase
MHDTALPGGMGPWTWLGTGLVPTAEARVSVLDRGLLRGEGVFETLRTYAGRPFAVTRHLARMSASAAAAGVRLPEQARMRTAIEAVADANRFPAARLQVTVTGGPGGPAPDPIGDPEPTLIVLAGPLPATEAVSVTAGVLPWVRHEGAALTGVKPTSYLDHLVGHKWARANGYDEGLWRNGAGQITEATGSNIFVVDAAGTVVTPPVSAGLLPGVTRDLILARCAARRVPTAERALEVADLYGAAECFLTSTTKEAVAVVAVDDKPIGNGTYPVLDAILADWRRWVLDNPDP